MREQAIKTTEDVRDRPEYCRRKFLGCIAVRMQRLYEEILCAPGKH